MFLLLFLLLPGSMLSAQMSDPMAQHPVFNQNPLGQDGQSPYDSFTKDPLFAARQLRALNVQRQKSLVSDTEKLLKLAQEFNKEVDTSNRTELTPVELRKLADIEKLARNVKQKMCLTFGGGPVIAEPIPHPVR